MKQIKNLEGGYYSTYAFVQKNELENIAEEVLGKDWEAEDDVAQIQAIIDYMNIGEYSVSCSEYDSREDDIIVTKIEDTPSSVERYFYNYVLVNVSRTWERIRVKTPNQEMPFDNIQSVDEIIEVADHIYEGSIIQGFINATEKVRKDDYWVKNTKEGMSDIYIEAEAERLIKEWYL